MAKFGVEHEYVKIFDLLMTFDIAKVRKFKMASKRAYFGRKWIIFIQNRLKKRTHI